MTQYYFQQINPIRQSISKFCCCLKNTMKSEDLKSQKGRLNRFANPHHGQLDQNGSEDEKTIIKTKISRGHSMTVKKTANFSPLKKMSTFSTKPHHKVSTDVISFEMEQQRNVQMKAINSEKQLETYYLAFQKLFTIIYQASHLINQHQQNLDSSLFQHKSVLLLCLIFEQPKREWTAQLLSKFKPLVKNVIYLSNNPRQFEKRIDFVARKATLQNDKRQKIKNAFLNPKIQRVWEQNVQNQFTDQVIQTFVQDQFDTPEEKLCFLQIKEFILNKLSTKQFGFYLQKYCVLHQIDDDLSLDFKFEFLLYEEFSFTVLPCLVKDNLNLKQSYVEPAKSQQSSCSIM